MVLEAVRCCRTFVKPQQPFRIPTGVHILHARGKREFKAGRKERIIKPRGMDLGTSQTRPSRVTWQWMGCPRAPGS